MPYVRAALYVDFDNVFSGLFKLDPDVAIQFAEDPGSWLKRLATTLTEGTPRRWLVLRCYLNPAGWLMHHNAAGESGRLFFSRFRPSFVRAGFEVVDCPRLNSTKNGADIRIVVDALDALTADAVYDEFVIASGDSDMTALLQRLRRADRRTMIVSPADAAESFTAIADRVLDSQQLLALVQGEPVEFDDEGENGADGGLDYAGGAPAVRGGAGRVARAGLGEAAADAAGDADPGEAYSRFGAIVAERYENASGPLNLASLAYQLRSKLGGAIDASNWFGYGGFARAVESLDLPNLSISQHHLWDEQRHQAPVAAAASAPQPVALPEPVARLAVLLSLPRLPKASWPPIYQALSDYADSHAFNLTQCTGWSRDRLLDQGFSVSRGAVGFVARGASFGGCPVFRQPPPSAAEIGAAFVANVLSRADTAGVSFTPEEVAVVQNWLGAAPAATAQPSVQDVEIDRDAAAAPADADAGPEDEVAGGLSSAAGETDEADAAVAVDVSDAQPSQGSETVEPRHEGGAPAEPVAALVDAPDAGGATA